jgi:hypothetical protein
MQPSEFFITLLHAATTAHILHLQTRSYAQHMALGSLYEALPGLVDGIIESFQSKYGIVKEYPSGYTASSKTPVEFVIDLRKFVEESRTVIGDDSELQSALDEIIDTLNSAIYKLGFLA